MKEGKSAAITSLACFLIPRNCCGALKCMMSVCQSISVCSGLSPVPAIAHTPLTRLRHLRRVGLLVCMPQHRGLQNFHRISQCIIPRIVSSVCQHLCQDTMTYITSTSLSCVHILCELAGPCRLSSATASRCTEVGSWGSWVCHWLINAILNWLEKMQCLFFFYTCNVSYPSLLNTFMHTTQCFIVITCKLQ